MSWVICLDKDIDPIMSLLSIEQQLLSFNLPGSGLHIYFLFIFVFVKKSLSHFLFKVQSVVYIRMCRYCQASLVVILQQEHSSLHIPYEYILPEAMCQFSALISIQGKEQIYFLFLEENN